MSTNPYAPPNAPLDANQQPEVVPVLWNPNAAANWCLLFTPAFGAYLHMKNWQALGDPAKAANSKMWFQFSLGFIGLVALSIFLPESSSISALFRPAGIALLVTWYVSAARPQANLVKERFGSAYPRRGWARPLLVAFLCTFGFIVAMFVLGVIKALLFGIRV
jgi:hypothetical protein